VCMLDWLLKRRRKEAVESISRPEQGWVSVWVADYTDELDLDGYSRSEFRSDHGVVDFDEGECAVHPQARPIDELLHGCWLADRWAEKAITICRQRGITEAPCVVVRVHYRHEPATPGTGPLRFAACVSMT